MQYALGPDVSDAVTDLLEGITPELRTQWLASEPRDWANESFAISEAAKTVYCAMDGGSCNMPAGSVTIDSDYLDANEPVVKAQLQKFAVRLARMLDDVLQK